LLRGDGRPRERVFVCASGATGPEERSYAECAAKEQGAGEIHTPLRTHPAKTGKRRV